MVFSDGVSLFRAFLQREFSEENIDFWIAVQEFKNTKPEKMQAKAKEIYEEFVAVQSPKEVRNSLQFCIDHFNRVYRI